MSRAIYGWEQLAEYVGHGWSAVDLRNDWRRDKLPFEVSITNTGSPVANSWDIDKAISEGMLGEVTESMGEASEVPYAIKSKLNDLFATFKELREMERYYPHVFKILGCEERISRGLAGGVREVCGLKMTLNSDESQYKRSDEGWRLGRELQEAVEYMLTKRIELMEFQDRLEIATRRDLVRKIRQGDQRAWNKLDDEWELAVDRYWETHWHIFRNLYD